MPKAAPTDKYIVLSGTDGSVTGSAFLSTERYVKAIGKNSGNLIFQYAAKRLVGEHCAIIGRDIPYHMGLIRKHARAVVVPSSNFLREGADFSNYVSFLERAELPLVFLGLGAQAENFDKTTFDFHPSVLRLLALIRERSKAVSVRGAFTAELLDQLGVQNVVVTGCPSNFINPDPDLADKIAAKAEKPLRTFLTHAEEPWPGNPDALRVDQRLLEWTLEGRAMMVQQSVPAVLGFMRGNNPASGAAPAAEFEQALQARMMPNSSLEAFRDFCALKLRTYISVEQWMEDSARFDFSLGMRLHGNMAAWQAGTPALWIHHDSRTRELCETMALPNIALEDFLKRCGSIKDARALWEFDPAAYSARRGALRAALDSGLEAHDIAIAA